MFAVVQANGKYHGHVETEAAAKEHVTKSKLEGALLLPDADYKRVATGANREEVFATGKPI